MSCRSDLPKEIDLAYQDLPDFIDYNFDVKPILSDKCYACHGPDQKKQKADLRLDLPEGAYKALGDGGDHHAIVPGKPQQSYLVKRILSKDKAFMMPPPESNLALSNREIAIITKWIEQGAEYKPHWSLIKPVKHELPQIKQVNWPQNPIDFFVLNKIEEKDLVPSEIAEKETLIRRLSFDLIGLPPTQDEVDKFVRDDASSNAYEKLIDRLLASPAYGERMAMEWMDVARYSDSDGYLDDKHRDFSPWRDWVIKAFNENMPYSQFATWQLAGDLLPESSKESILATAFNRLHRRNSEAGIVFEEYRVENVADRTVTLGKAFLGLTLECARCHDHKYDPVSQEDYYKVFGFFNSTNEIGTAVYGPDQTPGPSMLLTNDEQDEIIAFIEKSIKSQEQQLSKTQDPSSLAYQEWIKNEHAILHSLAANQQKGLVAHFPLDQYFAKQEGMYLTPDKSGNRKPAEVKEPEIKRGAIDKGLFLNGFTRLILPEKVGWFERTQPFTVSLSIFPDTVYREAGLFYHCEELRLGLKGYSLFLENNRLKFIVSHSWPTNAIQVKTKEPIPEKKWTSITITYDGSSSADGLRIYLNGSPVSLEIDYDNLYKGILFKPDIHTYGFGGFTIGERDKMKTFKGGGFDELKIYKRALSSLEVLYNFNQDKAKDVIAKGNQPSNQKLLTEYYFKNHNPSSGKIEKSLRISRDNLNLHLDSIPEIMVMGDQPKARPTFILDRGVYDAPTKQVAPGVPEAVLPLDKDLPANRLGLANWLFDPDHPLTARVFVNRIWQMHFGKGIVKTSDDFGNQGDPPSHPDLLDWLAVTFMESGWDMKKLHKLIVMSATYQQSSKVNDTLLEIDPDNTLLARGPSFRLPAEMIRDNALAISGLLVNEVGGSSAYPYQPEGLWDEISNKPWRYKYLQEPGKGLYRKSLYTTWKRTSPPPSMMIFDAPDRGVCIVKRSNTSTPMQALVLLNDPQFLEAARVLAENIITEDQNDSTYQLKTAFKLITGRIPDDKEIEILLNFYQDEITRFSGQQKDALAYLSIGEIKRDKSLDPVRTASLATVINGIMNTSEGYTRK